MNKEEIVSVLESLGLVATVTTEQPSSGEVQLAGGGVKH